MSRWDDVDNPEAAVGINAERQIPEIALAVGVSAAAAADGQIPGAFVEIDAHKRGIQA